jgi:hypothetical protein
MVKSYSYVADSDRSNECAMIVQEQVRSPASRLLKVLHGWTGESTVRVPIAATASKLSEHLGHRTYDLSLLGRRFTFWPGTGPSELVFVVDG